MHPVHHFGLEETVFPSCIKDFIIHENLMPLSVRNGGGRGRVAHWRGNPKDTSCLCPRIGISIGWAVHVGCHTVTGCVNLGPAPLYTKEFLSMLAEAGVESVKLPPRSPNLNAYAERFV